MKLHSWIELGPELSRLLEEAVIVHMAGVHLAYPV